MKILITGNMGYLGTVLAKHLRATMRGARLYGYDSGFFAHCLTTKDRLPESVYAAQYFGDVRDFPAPLLDGVDAVVHLAAISNDPIGNKFEKVTADINHDATIALARAAIDHGVKSFVFTSSCSLYGAAADGARKESDALNPLTAYARSKAACERDLRALNGKGMRITALRLATACGMSGRLRLDLVLNDFVASAMTEGTIKILSDGTPWRPLIDTQDIARAIEWGLTRDRVAGDDFMAVNIGAQACNYQVHALAESVARAIPGVKIDINTKAAPDKRSYQVDFGLFRNLAPRHQPQIDLDRSIAALRDGIASSGIHQNRMDGAMLIRLKTLESHIDAGRLSADLRWT
ncbi:MAG: SDR family oxidoreductase [Alphaproteobacteria bacterium]|nr:SDR family oxidoreductase [Alphaproteobacteria bacterium]